jgi:CRP-like cAMP-binding protein
MNLHPENIALLTHCTLFSGITPDEIQTLLRCIQARTLSLPKDSTIFMEGDTVVEIGIVLSGSVQISQTDYNGNRNVLAQLGAGELFGEVFACALVPQFPVSAICTTSSCVLLCNIQKLLTVCPHTCSFHQKLITNLLQVMARKSLALNRKIECMSQKTTREKLLHYLSREAKLQGSCQFQIPYNRQALADYLGVERSAMSTELGKLKAEGILDTHGSHFHLKEI